ncbi:MAG: hypothetical protein ACE5JP_01630 [Candidatus Bipolaricaulia bacterium]
MLLERLHELRSGLGWISLGAGIAYWFGWLMIGILIGKKGWKSLRNRDFSSHKNILRSPALLTAVLINRTGAWLPPIYVWVRSGSAVPWFVNAGVALLIVVVASFLIKRYRRRMSKRGVIGKEVA